VRRDQREENRIASPVMCEETLEFAVHVGAFVVADEAAIPVGQTTKAPVVDMD
jgi:hypothetical protein